MKDKVIKYIGYTVIISYIEDGNHIVITLTDSAGVILEVIECNDIGDNEEVNPQLN